MSTQCKPALDDARLKSIVIHELVCCAHQMEQKKQAQDVREWPGSSTVLRTGKTANDPRLVVPFPINVHAVKRSSQPWAPASTNGSQVCLSHHGEKMQIAELAFLAEVAVE
jgi:hypothetical protein